MTDAPQPVSAPPACGACGYDTTGLLSLTCPECGADLRVAGITRGRRSDARAGFVVSALALLVPWAVCGYLLMAAVSALVPARQVFRESMRLAAPRSNAYQAVDVVTTAAGWEGERSAARVEIQLVPAATASGAASPPAPLRASPGINEEAVLKWMAGAGIDTTDPRVRDEAQSVAMAAARSLRTRERYGAGTYSGSSVSGGTGRPFGRTSTSASAGSDTASLPVALFGALWLGLLVACVLFLRRTARK